MTWNTWLSLSIFHLHIGTDLLHRHVEGKDILCHLVTVERHVGNYSFPVLLTHLGWQESFGYLVPFLSVASLTGKIFELGV